MEGIEAATPIIGFSGTQKGMSHSQKARMYYELKKRWRPDAWFMHGDCIGSDEWAHYVAKIMQYRIRVHPPITPDKRAYCLWADELEPPRPYLQRNHLIVDMANFMLFTPKSDRMEQRSGTWATYRYARDLGLPLMVISRTGDELQL